MYIYPRSLPLALPVSQIENTCFNLTFFGEGYAEGSDPSQGRPDTKICTQVVGAGSSTGCDATRDSWAMTAVWSDWSANLWVCLCVLAGFTEPGYVATVSSLVQAGVTVLRELHSLPGRSVQSSLVLYVSGQVQASLCVFIQTLSRSLGLTGEVCTHQELPSTTPAWLTASTNTASASQSGTKAALPQRTAPLGWRLTFNADIEKHNCQPLCGFRSFTTRNTSQVWGGKLHYRRNGSEVLGFFLNWFLCLASPLFVFFDKYVYLKLCTIGWCDKQYKWIDFIY